MLKTWFWVLIIALAISPEATAALLLVGALTGFCWFIDGAGLIRKNR